MLRFQLKRISLSAHRSPARAGPSKRGFGSFISGIDLPKVPVLRPTLWAIAATATIYVGCATYNVYREVRIVKQRGDYKEDAINSYDDLDDVRKRGNSSHRIPSRPQTAAAKWLPTGQLSTILRGYTDAEKLTLCAAALNVSLVGANSLTLGSVERFFCHVPALSPNYTLLTSAFGHAGLFHVAVNTVVLLQFAPEVARSRIFRGNGSHFAAFYLSAGILSSLGNHLGTILPTRTYRINRFAPASGASGVIMALIGAWATMNPDEQIGILFIPGAFSARDMMTATVLFETFGLFIGIPYISVAHAAHLSGLAIGSAYAYFNGQKNLWHPTCQSAFLWMKRLKMI
ncbi:hypothetical protein F4781DRAFT_426201 [Annulohypoxylon bovei var. microspora]|nr:hypothetical protein F4781DRAFT_426201 [Annulohypoxylon bovei var. microspora]